MKGFLSIGGWEVRFLYSFNIWHTCQFLGFLVFGQIYNHFISSSIITPNNLIVTSFERSWVNSSDDLVFFNIEISGAAILLKPRMKR